MSVSLKPSDEGAARVVKGVGSGRRYPRYNIRRASSGEPASLADARQASRRIAQGRKLAVRTEVGRISRFGVPRRRRDLDSEPRRETAEPLLSGVDPAVTVPVACSLRAGWGNRHRKGYRVGLRLTTTPPTSGCIACEAFVPGNPGLHRVLRPA